MSGTAGKRTTRKHRRLTGPKPLSEAETKRIDRVRRAKERLDSPDFNLEEAFSVAIRRLIDANFGRQH